MGAGDREGNDGLEDGALPFVTDVGDPQQANPAKDTSKKAKPHYHGHRARLRERFLKAGSDAVQDYELLELVLFRALPRGDVKPLAKRLLEKFGSFSAVISAPLPRLKEVEGLGDAAATELKIVQAAALKLAQGKALDQPVLSGWRAVMDYCRAAMSRAETEQFRVLFLDHKSRLKADEVMSEGTINHTPVYPREVIKRAVELNASAIILVHNHPSGDPTPSRADIAMTKEIVAAGKALEITVHDHVVVGAKEIASFKALGLF
ncbi:MAG: RadC family protein [Alphaproteobacteria bacterium]